MLANITSESSHRFQKGNRNSGCRLCIMVCPSFWEDYYTLIYTHCWELMNSVGSHGSLSLLFVMKVMVCPFVSDSHEVMTALIVVLPLIVVVEISLQLHGSSFEISIVIWAFCRRAPDACNVGEYKCPWHGCSRAPQYRCGTWSFPFCVNAQPFLLVCEIQDRRVLIHSLGADVHKIVAFI